jgi:hypothetical protein
MARRLDALWYINIFRVPYNSLLAFIAASDNIRHHTSSNRSFSFPRGVAMLQKHDLLTKVYGGTLPARLHFCKAIHAEFSPRIMADLDFARSFDALLADAGLLTRQMAKMAMGAQCTACSAGNRGGCCSRAIADETDAIQMVMNMLAGVEVEILCDNGKECCFLGEKGCIFLFKPMFCLNYNCDKIVGATAAEELLVLERLTGRVLRSQYEVETMLLAMLLADQLRTVTF